MTEHIIPAEAPAPEHSRSAPWTGFRAGFFSSSSSVSSAAGSSLVDGAERVVFGRVSAAFPLEAVITVHHQRFYGDCLFRGTIGAGEAYMAGFWSTDDLTAVVRIFALHPEVFSGMDKGMARIMAPVVKYAHALNKNTRAGSRRNIVAHYDLGNDFYRLFLDETLTYSCGIFERPESTLAEASLGQVRAHLQKAGPDGLRPPARDRHRLGRLCPACGAALRLPGHHDHHLRPAARGGRPAHCGGRALRAHHAAQAGLPRFDRQLRQTRLDRDDRSRGPSVFGRVLPSLQPAPEVRGRRCCSRRSRSGTRSSTGTRKTWTSSSATSFPEAASPRWRPSASRRPGHRPAPVPPGGHHPALRHDPPALAREFLPQPRAGQGAGIPGHLHPHVGVLFVLLRGGLCRALPGGRADALHQAHVPQGPHPAAIKFSISPGGLMENLIQEVPVMPGWNPRKPDDNRGVFSSKRSASPVGSGFQPRFRTPADWSPVMIHPRAASAVS
jgi:hypothetical protein